MIQLHVRLLILFGLALYGFVPLTAQVAADSTLKYVEVQFESSEDGCGGSQAGQAVYLRNIHPTRTVKVIHTITYYSQGTVKKWDKHESKLIKAGQRVVVGCSVYKHAGVVDTFTHTVDEVQVID